MQISQLKKILVAQQCSCVIFNHNQMRTFHHRGIRDVLELFKSEPEFLRGSILVDKVIGSAAASVMIVGGVKEIYTLVISQGAKELFEAHDIVFGFDTLIPYIHNRTQSDLCPMERACRDAKSPQEAVEVLKNWKFIINP